MGIQIIEPAVRCKLEASSQGELFAKMAAPLLEAGLVKEGYAEHVGRREESFPTGLPLGDLGIAVPHTDPEHVNAPAIAVATLAHPIVFKVMGSPNERTSVRLVFMLALDEGHEHLDVLKKIMGIAGKRDDLEAILQASSDEELLNIVGELLDVQ